VKESVRATTGALVQASKRHFETQYMLRLYVSDMTPRSRFAFENVKSICEEYLHGHYHLEVIDIFQNSARMRRDQVIAAPTLIKRGPEPLRRLVGDMSNREHVLRGLGLKPLAA
jgi:circadian clock protein KaiB